MNKKIIDKTVNRLFREEGKAPLWWKMTLNNVEEIFRKRNIIYFPLTDWTQVLMLIISGNLKEHDILQAAIYNGANVQEDNDFPLREAAKFRDQFAVKYLLENGSNPLSFSQTELENLKVRTDDDIQVIYSMINKARNKILT